jgi:hypothetical protein
VDSGGKEETLEYFFSVFQPHRLISVTWTVKKSITQEDGEGRDRKIFLKHTVLTRLLNRALNSGKELIKQTSNGSGKKFKKPTVTSNEMEFLDGIFCRGFCA